MHSPAVQNISFPDEPAGKKKHRLCINTKSLLWEFARGREWGDGGDRGWGNGGADTKTLF